LVKARGRLATTIRPGGVIKGVLQGQIPLEPKGENPIYVSVACVKDLHNTYKRYIYRENLTRPKHKQLRGMTYFSFCTWLRFAKYLGLIEKVSEEQTSMHPDMSRVTRQPSGRIGARRTSKIYYQLTPLGAAEERMWENLKAAWLEKWKPGMPPLEVEYKIPEIEHVEFSIDNPNADHFRKAAYYLRKALRYTKVSEEARNEAVYIAEVVLGWRNKVKELMNYAQEKYADTGDTFWRDQFEMLDDWYGSLSAAVKKFSAVRFEEAADILSKIKGD